MKMKYMKRAVVLTGMLAAMSCFAQSGHGVSGPDTGGSKVNTDEKLLTRSEFKTIVQGCLDNEMLDLARTLGKDPNLVLNGAQYHQMKTCEGSAVPGRVENGKATGCPTVVYSAYLKSDQESGQITYEVNFGGRMADEASLTIYLTKEVDGQPKDWNLAMDAFRAGTMQYSEMALPGAYDEYGNVVQDKILVNPIAFQYLHGDPVDLTQGLTLYNHQTHQPIQGVTFNQPRYASCIALQVGKYTPSK